MEHLTLGYFEILTYFLLITAKNIDPMYLSVLLSLVLFSVSLFLIGLVISAPQVARPLYCTTTSSPVGLTGTGSVSPARKTASALEPSTGKVLLKVQRHCTPTCPHTS